MACDFIVEDSADAFRLQSVHAGCGTCIMALMVRKQITGLYHWCSRSDKAPQSTCNLFRQDAHGAKTGRSQRDADSASGVHDIEAVAELQQLHVCRDWQPGLHQPLRLLH